MSNLFYGLNIAKNTLRAQTSALNVTAHNIANANTPGYSRQKVHLAAVSDDVGGSGRMSAGRITIGSGVEAKEVSRIRFALYDEIYRKENQDLHYNEKTEDLLYQVELLFDEPSERGLGGTINSFFNGWLDLANAPHNIAARQSLYSIANEMTDHIKRIYNSLIIMREDVATEISAIPNEINKINAEIADLNNSIRKTENQRRTANDLRDRRDLLIDNLSEFVAVRAVEQKDGSVTVLIGSKVVVDHDTFSVLSSSN